MPTNVSQKITEIKDAVYQQIMDTTPTNDESILTSNAKIRETATHDFTSYEFIYEPLLSTMTSTMLSSAEQELIFDTIKAAVAAGIPNTFYETEGVGTHEGTISEELAWRWDRDQTPGMDNEALSRRIYRGPFVDYVLPLIMEALSAYSEAEQEGWLSFFALEFNDMLIAHFEDEIDDNLREEGLNAVLFDDAGFWENITRKAIENVPALEQSSVNLQNRTRTFGRSSFTPFEPDTVNFGLQLVYRQVWIPLGTQAGEVVKTIPLGPGQTEKVSIKSIKRQKVKRSYEQTEETESSSESTETTRDSSEVVDQASSTFQWSTDISASASWGWGSASASASLGGSKSNSSSSTKNNLNEAMSKTADKLRVETKIAVSTETSSETEYTQSSEIKNENDEVAVTYVYSKLQRQYEIHTYLAEVNTVVFVASPIPTRAEMNPNWFGKNSHILRPVLMNDVYVRDLETILSHNTYAHDSNETQPDSHYVSIMSKVATDGLPDIAQTPGTPPDYLASAMEVYDRDKERGRANRQAQRTYEKSLARLSEHIEENALYYGRAFWQAKDPDMRMMEYANVRVPLRWRYQDRKMDYRTGRVITPGGYIPAVSSIEDMARLSDIVNPAGPVGYAGNYLAFYVRSDKNLYDLKDPLAAMRTPYLKRYLEVDEVAEGVKFLAVPSHTYTIPQGGLELKIELEENEDEELIARLSSRAPNKDFISKDSEPVNREGGEIKFNILKVILRPSEGEQLQAGMTFQAHLDLLPAMEDPELGQMKWEIGPSIFETGEELFTPEIIDDMASALFTVKEGLDKGRLERATEKDWHSYSEDTQAMLQRYYPDYLLKKRHTRRFLLDTDNVFLTRIVDNTSSLEPFKDTHRNLDILRTIEEISQQQLETLRIDERLIADDLSDPDIETRTVVVDADTNVDVDA